MIFCSDPHYITNPSLRNISKFAHLVSMYDGKFYKDLTFPPPAVSEDNFDKFTVVDVNTGVVYPQYLEVPCGKCELCRDRRRSSLVRRLNYEFAVTSCVPLFITLTFDDEHYHHVALEEDIQDYIRRVREYYYKQNKVRLHFKYFAVSEHGKRTNRLHYHLLLFDFPQQGVDDCIKYIQNRWFYGHVHVEFVAQRGSYKLNNKSYKSVFNYVSKYVCKDGSDSEICLYSKGLGSKFLIDNFRSFCNDNPTCKDLVYYDYASNQFRPIVIDKTFIYYVFWKSKYYRFLQAFRSVRDRGTVAHRSYIHREVSDGLLLPEYAPFPSSFLRPGTSYLSDDEFSVCMQTIIDYQFLQVKSLKFCASNQKYVSPTVFKELRDLRLSQIRLNIEHIIDKEKL